MTEFAPTLPRILFPKRVKSSLKMAKTTKVKATNKLKVALPKNTLVFKKKIEEQNRSFFSKVPFAVFVLASFVLNILVIMLVFVISRFLPPEVPLLYGFPEGQDQLVSTYYLAIPSLVSLVITIINLILSSFVSDSLSKNALVFTSLVLTLFSFITTVKIIFLVGSI
ncbi:hypothetical protein ACFL0F_02560 [Patescibacteria group bacterium]